VEAVKREGLSTTDAADRRRVERGAAFIVQTFWQRGT
jgi:hypothetical protein